MVPRGLIIATSVGITAGALFGIFFVNLNDNEQLEFAEGASLSIVTEKIDFELGEKISIRIINSGTEALTFSDASYGLKITGLDGRILYSPIAAQVISILEPKEEVTLVWDQTKNDGERVLEGRYKISSTATDVEEDIVKKSVSVNILK